MKALLVSVALLFPVILHASQIVTLTQANQTLAVEPADVVELVTAVAGSSDSYAVFTMQAGGTAPYYYIPNQGVRPPSSTYTAIMTGVTQVRLSRNNSGSSPLLGGDTTAATFRITKQAEQFVSQPVIMPAITDQKYKVELETSTDLQNWIPSVPGDYLGGSTNRFFRVKVSTKPD